MEAYVISYSAGSIGYLLAPEIRYYGDRAYYNIADRLDSRSPKFILFIGNSRTFYHDMPMMVRKVADSADSPYRFVISQHTIPGGQLSDHVASEKLNNLLHYKWDEIIIQGEGLKILIQ